MKIFGKLEIDKGCLAGVLLLCTAGAVGASQFLVYAPDAGQLGGPVEGLSPVQLKKFYETRKVFQKEFVPEEGLGPLFNGKSCFECHGQPGATGGEGRDVVSTGVVRIGKLKNQSPLYGKPMSDVKTRTATLDVYTYITEGGPALERKSITSEFANKYPFDCQVEIGAIPKDADFISLRHSPPLFGFGLIDAIPDSAITERYLYEFENNPEMAGRPACRPDPLTQRFRNGRFGWKDQQSTLLQFTAEAMNVEMGITSSSQPSVKSALGLSQFPHCILHTLPGEPNDNGKLQAQLAYFQSLLAAPKRGAISPQVKRGEQVFERLQCAFCHVPQMSTASRAYVVDPDSPFPRFNKLEVPALERKIVAAYSDLLVHNMGPELADGLPQAGATGGEWRTTPLWGLRNKKFLLHDGRTRDLTQAILAHGGQSLPSKEAFNKLAQSDREDLLAFLRSL